MSVHYLVGSWCLGTLVRRGTGHVVARLRLLRSTDLSIMAERFSREAAAQGLRQGYGTLQAHTIRRTGPGGTAITFSWRH